MPQSDNFINFGVGSNYFYLMVGRKYFFIGVTALVFVSFLDLFITWLITPDLKNEGNAFVVQYGLGWLGIICISIAYIIFVSIPFYYHSIVFSYPLYKGNTTISVKYLIDFFFKNNTNIFFSITNSLFNILGFYLFWWYIISKATAVIHNLLLVTVDQFAELSFPKRIEILKWADNSLVIIVMILFFIKLIYRPDRFKERRVNRGSIHFIFVILFFLLYGSFKFFISTSRKSHSIQLTYEADPEIVLINVGDNSRASIARMISAVDSCKPAVICLDIVFRGEKDTVSDSTLASVLKHAKNDILAYFIRTYGIEERSIDQFRKEVNAEGLVSWQRSNGLVTKFTPLEKKNGELHESLAFAVVKLWKPEFNSTIMENESVLINYTRTSERFLKFEGATLSAKENCEYLKGKIVLLGYLGPTEEDKHFTPIRYVKRYGKTEPDTYGLVILANEIRTILNHKKID